MKKISTAALLVLMLLFVFICAAQAQSPQQTLNQYVSDLQKNPGDYALREKIIRHAQTMKPAPAVPEEARRQYVMGKTLFEEAKNVQDFKDAIEKFRKALLIAPWWPEANRDLGMALQAAQEYAEAIRALKLYIATNPGEELARRAQNEIYKIEAKQEKATKESSRQAQAAAAPKQNSFEDLLRKIDGRRYTCTESSWLTSVLDVRGRIIVRGTIENGRYLEWTGEASRVEIRGRETTVPLYYRPFKVSNAVSMTFLISEDGYSITVRTKLSSGDSRDYIHLWQR